MVRIFNANMFRLKKSRLFWQSVILTAPATAGAGFVTIFVSSLGSAAFRRKGLR